MKIFITLFALIVTYFVGACAGWSNHILWRNGHLDTDATTDRYMNKWEDVMYNAGVRMKRRNRKF